jgi:VWFA-related protein
MKGASYVLGLIAFAASLVVFGHAQQPPSTIRTGITSVPIDVRVVDRNGKPVTDLTQEDFTILEDGVRQQIQHFSKHEFTADPAAMLPEPLFRSAASPTLATQNRRVFLIVLGRGRHQDVSKYADALARFLGERVLPQDQIALLGWNRATDFTTNRALIRQTVERYRDRHARIETNLSEWFSGLRAVYGSKEIPPHIQRDIDSVFEESVALRPRELTPGQITSTERVGDATRRAAGDLLRDTLVAPPGDGSILAAPLANPFIDIELNELLRSSSQLQHDLGNLYAGVEYLRYLEGEKHLVLLTERGVSLPFLEMNTNLAQMASDGRIALDIIQTGGVEGPAPLRIGPRGGIVMERLALPRTVFAQGFAVQDLRQLADMTGGQLQAFRTAEEAFRRLEDGIGFQYLLAYYPSNPKWDGKYRKVTLKVNRPDVRVMYRQGYFATNQIVPLDRRQFVTSGRIDAAARYGGVVDHLKVTVKDTVVEGSGGTRALTAHLTVDISRVKFAREGELNIATLDVALYCGDDKEKVVGEARQKIDLKLTDALRESMLKDGTSFTSRVPLTGHPRVLKVIVYDYGADLVGTAVTKVR